MDVSSISAKAMMMQASQTRQGMATSLLKMAAGQQGQLADMLALTTQSAPQTASDSRYTFSIYV